MNLDVRWLSIFADVPAPSLEESLTFWEQVTGARRGAAAGDEDEFVSL